MPIIGDVEYNVEELYPKTIIFQLYKPEETELHHEESQKKKGIYNYLRKLIMRSSENNIMRPRKIHSNWTTASHNSRSMFSIGEFQETSGNNNSLAVALPLGGASVHESEIKYKRKTGRIKKIGMICLRQIENYFENSTLHGLRYIGNTSLSLGERLFWLGAFSFALSFAAYYITNIFEKWNNNPVLIAFSPFDADFNEIPFPAITICNMNQAKNDEAQKILNEGSDVEMKLLDEYCNGNHSFSSADDDAPDWNTVQNFLIKVGQSCSDTVKYCSWENTKLNDCSTYFNNDLTDEGLCCSFNRLPPNILYKNANDVTVLNQTYPNITYDWSPERGFPDKNSGNISVIPIRPSGSGAHLGLTLVIDADVNNYYCSSTSSVGFKIMFSNPMESPKIADFGYLVSPGNEVRYAFHPDIREATTSLRSVAISKRKCYFENERPLKFYRTYSARNCRLECQSEYTLQKCECIPYYLPKSKSTRVCGKKKEDCVLEAKKAMELVYGNGSSCNCLPSCFEMSFDKSDTQSTLFSLNSLYAMDKTFTTEEFQKDVIILHFYFKESRFRKQIKSEIYGFTEALSNIGGLLGLFLGFSCLSLVELFYFISLRIVCRYAKTKLKTDDKKHPPQHQLQEWNKSNSTIPFMK